MIKKKLLNIQIKIFRILIKTIIISIIKAYAQREWSSKLRRNWQRKRQVVQLDGTCVLISYINFNRRFLLSDVWKRKTNLCGRASMNIRDCDFFFARLRSVCALIVRLSSGKRATCRTRSELTSESLTIHMRKRIMSCT